MNPYSFFVQACSNEHKRKHPEEKVDFHEFTKKCSERWKTMSDKEKKRFYQMAEVEKKRYDVEMAVFEARKIPFTGKRKKEDNGKPKKKRIKDPNAPKRNMSAFFLYSRETRSKVKEANPNFGVGEIAKELGRRWAEASPEIKAKYEAQAEAGRSEYEEAKRKYQETLKSAENNQSVNIPSDVDDDSSD